MLYLVVLVGHQAVYHNGSIYVLPGMTSPVSVEPGPVDQLYILNVGGDLEWKWSVIRLKQSVSGRCVGVLGLRIMNGCFFWGH